MQAITLKQPFHFNGEEIREIRMDLEALTGADLIQVEAELASQGKVVLMSDYSKLYLSRVGARAAKLPGVLMDRLPAKAFTKMTTEVQNFLLAADSEDGSDEPAADTTSTEPPAESSGESPSDCPEPRPEHP